MAGSVHVRRFIIILGCSLILMGCRDKNDQQASDEATETTTSLSKIRSDLTRAKRNLADSTEELRAVKDIRDELDKQVAQITAERDNAVKAAMAAEQKIKGLTAQLSEMPDGLGSLEDELKKQNTVIDNQRMTMSEQQAAMSEQQAIITEQEATIAALEKIIQEQMTVEQQPQEEIPEPEPEVEEQ
jgi:chemotaxis protein MotB